MAQTISVSIQDLKFNLMQDKNDEFNAEHNCLSKIELPVMKALIEEMINKGFYQIKEDLNKFKSPKKSLQSSDSKMNQ